MSSPSTPSPNRSSRPRRRKPRRSAAPLALLGVPLLLAAGVLAIDLRQGTDADPAAASRPVAADIVTPSWSTEAETVDAATEQAAARQAATDQAAIDQALVDQAAADQAAIDQAAADRTTTEKAQADQAPALPPIEPAVENAALPATFDKHVWTHGFQREIDACKGAVDVTGDYGVAVIAEHWSCGGSWFPGDGSVITLSGVLSGTYLVGGIATVLDANTQGTADVPRGYDLLYQTCIDGSNSTMSFTVLTKID